MMTHTIHLGKLIAIIPKPENLFGHFGGDFLTTKPPFMVTNRRVRRDEICPERW